MPPKKRSNAPTAAPTPKAAPLAAFSRDQLLLRAVYAEEETHSWAFMPILRAALRPVEDGVVVSNEAALLLLSAYWPAGSTLEDAVAGFKTVFAYMGELLNMDTLSAVVLREWSYRGIVPPYFRDGNQELLLGDSDLFRKQRRGTLAANDPRALKLILDRNSPFASVADRIDWCLSHHCHVPVRQVDEVLNGPQLDEVEFGRLDVETARRQLDVGDAVVAPTRRVVRDGLADCANDFFKRRHGEHGSFGKQDELVAHREAWNDRHRVDDERLRVSIHGANGRARRCGRMVKKSSPTKSNGYEGLGSGFVQRSPF